MRKAILVILAFVMSTSVHSEDRLVTLPTRGGQTISYWWMPGDDASATVLLFSGGSGGIGYADGRPTSGNFLVRSREYFRTEGFNVALVGNPSDKRQLDDSWRISGAHILDVSNIIDDISKSAKLPVWLIGTSRGTVSVAAAGIGLQEKIAGIVLSASMTSYKQAASVPKQDIDRIKVPVLVYHHKNDACILTVPQETDWIMRALKNASIKRQMIVSGGENPTGDPCEAFHWHGFIGMEGLAVKDIADWIKHPVP